MPPDVQAKVDRGELAITQALKARDGRGVEESALGVKKRPTKQKKIKTSVGITITLKARKNLKDDEMKVAVQEVVAALERAA